MEQIKFFTGRFTIVPLLATLQKHGASYQRLCEQWDQFGYNLNLLKDDVNSLQEKLRAAEKGNRDFNILREILRLWKCRGDDANLKVLFEALRDIGLDDAAELVRDEFAEAGHAPTPHRSSMSRLSLGPEPWQMSTSLQADEESDVNASLNASNPGYFYEYKGNILLFQAILEGQSVSEIANLLHDHHDDYVNIKENVAEGFWNAAHVVMQTLISRVNTIDQALDIFNLLVVRGFRGINDGGKYNITPLHRIMWMEFDEPNDLNKLVEWLATKGADINAVDCYGCSVLLIASRMQHEITVRKLLELGAIAGVTDSLRENEVHMSAWAGNANVLKLFIEQYQLDVNQKTVDGCTPLHFLFEALVMYENMDYRKCLEVLLEKGAQFDAKNNEGLVPLVHWLKRGTCNQFFSALMQMKEKLHITQEIASLALTAIVEGIERFQRFLPCSELKDDNHNDTEDPQFSEFVHFLLWDNGDVKAKLLFNDEGDGEKAWKQHDWRELTQILNTNEFSRVLHKATRKLQWNRVEPVRATELGRFGFPTSHGLIGSMRAGYILGYCLEARMYDGFVRICEILKPFCRQ